MTEAHALTRAATPGAQRFTRAQRILKTDDFSSVFRLRPTRKTDHFVLYTRPSLAPVARLGVVAAKRLAPRAVTRNMIRRLAREAFRRQALPALDCVIRLARPVNTRHAPATGQALKRVLRQEIDALFVAASHPVRSRT